MKYSRTRLYNTKPAAAPSLSRTFSIRKSRKKTGPITKWPPGILLFTLLEIVFVTFSTITKRTKVVHKAFSHGPARNTNTTASAVSFSAILSCEMLDFGQQLVISLCRRYY